MKINLKNGIENLLFGMKPKDVIAIYGNPDREYKDEEDNIIYLYNSKKLRLTFYEEEDFKLGYIITSNSDCTLLENKLIAEDVDEIINKLSFKNWEIEDFDLTVNYFNESNWLTIQSEFGKIIRVEIGAIITDLDSFDWKFKS